jgi:citrate synthase
LTEKMREGLGAAGQGTPGDLPGDNHSGVGELRIQDRRTDREYVLPIDDGAIHATDLDRITAPAAGADRAEGLVSYDPGFANTACCRSSITFIDGDQGILRYRGYPIEQVAGRVSFLDVAWLLIHGELPTVAESAGFAATVEAVPELPAPITAIVDSFPSDAHPMSVLLSAWSALSAYRAEAKQVDDEAVRMAEVPHFPAWIAALTSLVFRHRTGRPRAPSAISGSYSARLLGSMFPEKGVPDAALVRALDLLLVLQADHEQNCSTNAVRSVGSSRVDPYSAFAGGIAALYGPLHGGANEAVVRMLHEVGTVANVPALIERVKHGQGRLMGFGHRVYKSYDPRAAIIRATAEEVFRVTGRNSLLDVALAIETVALQDSYFVDRKLYPNVDFYSGLIYEAMGLPIDTYTTIFAVARMAGWVAQWLEMIADHEQRIARPKQLYVGPGRRDLPS